MNQSKKITFLASLGAALEYYDFVIYGMMAKTLSTLFFPSDNPSLALMKSFAIFSVGYLVRPLGGIFFGMMADSFGRKKSFLLIMFLMAFSTFFMGALPTYESLGVTASVLLVLLRIFQGISFGAELPTAITVVTEHTEKRQKGTFSGFLISSVSVGSTLATLMLYLLTTLLQPEEVLKWGWRIPFFFGGTLAIVNFFIRKGVQETPEFSSLQKKYSDRSFKEPLVHLLKYYKGSVFTGIGMTSVVAGLVIFSLYLPTYLKEYYHIPEKEVFYAMTWGMVWSIFSLPLSGILSDKLGHQRVFFSTSLLVSLLIMPLFNIVNEHSLIAFMVIYQTALSLLSASYFALISSLFPTQVRVTGIAASYNIAYSLMGLLPIFSTALIQMTGLPSIALWIIILFSLISSFCCFNKLKVIFS